MLQELLAISSALPAYAGAIGKLWNSILTEYSGAAAAAVAALTRG